jgi:aerobic C4-dicarboxylate transport protein
MLVAATRAAPKKPFWRLLYVQVIAGVVLGALLGYLAPAVGIEMKPFGDGFIKAVKMVIGLVVFCTVVSGIAGMQDMKSVGRVGAKSLLYFEAVSTLALLVGLAAALWLRPGAGFNADPARLDGRAVAQYANVAHGQGGFADFLLSIIPDTLLGALARGDILPVVFVSVLVGVVIARMGVHAAPVRAGVNAVASVVFGLINLLMRVAPLGAFGAMAFTVGRYGIASLLPLATLVAVFYGTAAVFVLVVLGAIARAAGFSIIHLLACLKEELLIVLGTSSSDPVLPALMEELEYLGCGRGTVGLVVPTGYVFNTDGSSIYMTLAALFVAQATNTDLSWMQIAAILGVAMLTSKGASGVTGASFIALVATLQVVPAIPVAGMALILGVDRFMSEVRALVNVIGNAVATIVVAGWEGQLDRERMAAVLSGRLPAQDYRVGGPVGLAPLPRPAIPLADPT